MSYQLSNTIKSTLLASVAGAVMSFSMASTAAAQTSEPDPTDSGEEIIATGIRATLDNALANKRKADVILDGISADDLGNFPDLNLGEALQRISLNITDYRNDAPNLTDLDPAGRSDIYIGDIRRFTNKIVGDRLSAAGGFEYAPSENFNLRLDGIYAQRNLNDATQDIVQVQPRRSAAQVTSPDDGQLIGTFDFDRNGTPEDVYLHQVITSDDPQVAFGNRRFPSLEETWALYPQMTWENEDLKLNLIGTYSKAKNRVILDQFDARLNHQGN